MKSIYLIACLLAAMHTHAQGILFEQHKTLEQILAQAKKEHKQVFINCYMRGGKPCIEMDKNVFPVKAVGDYYNSRYVSLAINMEQLPVDENARAVADTLRKRYGVNGYPNLLFLDASGKLLHRYMGSTTPEGLITQGRNALDPGKQFYTQLECYKAGKRDTANMRQLAIDAFNFSDSKLAHNIAGSYLQGKTDQQLANPDDIALIALVLQDHEKVALLSNLYIQSLSSSQKLQNMRFIVQQRDQPDTIAYYINLFLLQTTDSLLLTNSSIGTLAQVAYQQGSSSKSYQYLWLHRTAVDSVLKTPQSLIKLFSSNISKDIITPFMKQAGDTPDWNSLQQAVTAKYSSDYADRCVIQTKLSWYISHKEWPVCMQLLVELDKKYGAQRAGYEVKSELGDPVIKRSTDPAIMQYALGRMQQVIDTQSPSASEVTTYAKLLYITGRKADAIRWEKIALKTDPDNKDISTVLEQMNNGTLIPQYPPADSSRASWVKQLKPVRTQIPTPPYHYSVENVRFNGNGHTYGATLTRPTGLKSFPTVVLITGTSPQDRDYTCYDHKYFWVLADYLSNHGIAVLRMDDRGMAESSGNYFMATTRDFAQDILASVQWLHTRKDIDTARIGLIGHSEGGIIAPMTYTMSPGSTKFLVLICGPVVGLRYINRFQSRQQFEKTYKSDTLVAAKMRLHDYIVSNIPAHAHDTGEMHQLLRHAADTFYETESRAISEKLRIKNDDHTAIDLNRSYKAFLKPWWQYILDYNPLTDIHQLQCPVLGIYGEKDQQVPPVEDFNLLKANLPPHQFSEVVMMENMSHFMQPDTGDGSWENYEKIETTIMPALLEKVATWINILPK